MEGTRMDIDNNEIAEKVSPATLAPTNSIGLPDQDKENRLALPKLEAGGKWSVEHTDIQNVSKARLSDLCRQYKLPHSGNMGVLRERLTKFSIDTDKWDERLKPSAQRSHLGPQPGRGKKATNQKKSFQRRELLLGGSQSNVQAQGSLSAKTLPTTAAESADHEMIMNWATFIKARFPYQDKATREQIAFARRQQARSYAPNNPLLFNINASANTNCGTYSTSVSTSRQQSFNSSPSTITYQTSNPSHPSSPSDPSPPPPSSPSESNSDSDLPSRLLKLGDGTILTLAESDVPPPPAVSFKNDLPILNAMWDDTTANWGGNSHLIICGRPIALVYWPTLYMSQGQKWKKGQWGGIKGKWSEWKAIVTRWRQGGADHFWAEFSNGDKHLGYKAIVAALRAQRSAKDEAIALHAKNEHQEDFTTVFTYQKSGKVYVMTDAKAIVKKYYELHDIETDSDNEME
ncbi:hypothetical protein CPB83DRAFT_817327 [Crepidotus variabilis]|uniref:SAP domain-containing protein n=1 Tax=Crepidotus variabilis TaxID=179855 RepID=A0A9P6JN59_9AGAR|nr:hypothetical protein CPB83DRAFT_817327 [Crepidotus variabilis]